MAVYGPHGEQEASGALHTLWRWRRQPWHVLKALATPCRDVKHKRCEVCVLYLWRTAGMHTRFCRLAVHTVADSRTKTAGTAGTLGGHIE